MPPDAQPLLTKSEIVRVVSDVLAFNGFEVTFDFRVKGLSGYDHAFQIYAQRGDVRLLIDVPVDVFELLASLAKRVDVRGFVSLIVVERRFVSGILPEVVAVEGEMLKGSSFIAFDDIEDLRKRLQVYLTAKTGMAR